MTHNKLTSYLNCFIILLGIVCGVAASSCNAKDEDVVPDNYVTTESVAITAFSLTADLRVMRNLDSVYFSIDLEHGVVFNADSLPKGTNVTKLIPKISYPSSVTSAVIEMTGGTHREGTVKYHSNSTDTIDFSGHVTLTLSTSDNAITKTYNLKVNVHKEDPDTIYWDNIYTAELPSRMPSPKAQKSVAFGKGVMSLIEEADGSHTISTTQDIFQNIWVKDVADLKFAPVIESLTSSDYGLLYILDNTGTLYESEDGKSWHEAASGWQQIIGPYGETLLGMKSDAGKRVLTSLDDGNYDQIVMPENFPVSGYTAPIEFSNRWSTDPTIVIFGGLTPSGTLSSASWAFDGSQWADISDNALPALEGLSVVNYYSYLKSASNSILKEFEAYLAFGGRDSFGNANHTIYITYDHGINWQRAQEYMQFPSGVQAGFMVNALTMGTERQGNLSDRWNVKRRLPFEIDGDIIKWECPYIFLFGGYDTDMQLIGNIRSGVLQRLTFVPLF